MARRRSKAKKNGRSIRSIAKDRIETLYNYAVKEAREGNYEYASQLMHLAKRISMKNRVRIPRRIKRWVCKNCMVPLIPGVTATVRLRRDGGTSRVIVHCRICGWMHRRPYKPWRNKAQHS